MIPSVQLAADLLRAVETPVTAAPLPLGNYTFFKLRAPLTISRRGKDTKFQKGDNLGWRYSSSGRHFRLVSPLTGPNVVYSIPITDESLDWLMKQDPKAKKPAHKRPSPPVPETPPGKKPAVTPELFEKEFLPVLKKHAAQVLRNIVREANETGADQMRWKVMPVKVQDTRKYNGGFEPDMLFYLAFKIYFPYAQITDPNMDLRDKLQKALNKKTKLKSPLSIHGVPIRTQVMNQFFRTKDTYEFVYYVPVK